VRRSAPEPGLAVTARRPRPFLARGIAPNGMAGPSLVAGEVRRRPRWPLLVDESMAQLGVWLARVVEVAAQQNPHCVPRAPIGAPSGVSRLCHTERGMPIQIHPHEARASGVKGGPRKRPAFDISRMLSRR
jgi:hypothetical protein